MKRCMAVLQTVAVLGVCCGSLYAATMIEVGFEKSLPADSACVTRYAGSNAFGGLTVDGNRAHAGLRSMAISVSASGTHHDRVAGECYMDLAKLGTGISDLEGSTYTAWVYVPPEAATDISRPAGYQLFVKDAAWQGLYGVWSNCMPGRWVQLTIKVSSKPQPGCWKSEGFDAKRVRCLGLKYAVGAGSAAQFVGKLWWDDIKVTRAGR